MAVILRRGKVRGLTCPRALIRGPIHGRKKSTRKKFSGPVQGCRLRGIIRVAAMPTPIIWGGEAAHITLAPGSQALIERLPALFEKTTVYIAGPTYSEHEICWKHAGHNVKNFKDVTEGSVVIFCAPNNPDGQHPDRVDFVRRHTQGGGYVIIDEAFADLDPERSLIGPDLPERVIVLRSFGKFFGLAGLRLGAAYTKGPVKIASGLWDISTPTLLIAAQALADQDWITQARKNLGEKMIALTELFRKKGYEVIGQTDLFCLVRGPERDKLAEAGIFVRSFDDRPCLRFGLPPTEQDFQKLEDAL